MIVWDLSFLCLNCCSPESVPERGPRCCVGFLLGMVSALAQGNRVCERGMRGSVGPKHCPRVSLISVWASLLPSTHGLHFLLTSSPSSQLTRAINSSLNIRCNGRRNGGTFLFRGEISILPSPPWTSQSGEESIEEMT